MQPPARTWHVGAAAALAARRLALCVWQAAARRTVVIPFLAQLHPDDPHLGRLYKAPTTTGTIAQYTGECHFLYQQLHWRDIGPTAQHTPLSLRAPGCHGAILSMTRAPRSKVLVLARLQLGNHALALYPWVGRRPPGAPAPDVDSLDSDSEDDGSDSEQDTQSSGPAPPYYGGPAECRFCRMPKPDLWHVACQCAPCSATHGSSRECVVSVLQALADLAMHTGSPGGAQLKAAIQNAPLHPSTDVGRAVFFRILSVLPWGERHAALCDPADVWTSIALSAGVCMDAISVPPHQLRRFADRWVTTAYRAVIHVVHLYRS